MGHVGSPRTIALDQGNGPASYGFGSGMSGRVGLWCRKFSSPGIKPESGLVTLSNGGRLGHVGSPRTIAFDQGNGPESGFCGWGARWVVRLGPYVAEAICAAVVEYLLMIHGASARTTMSPKPANTIPCFSERLTSPQNLFGTPFQTLPFNGSVASSDEFPTRLDHCFTISSKCVF